jgi:lipopolysaccharide exporter
LITRLFAAGDLGIYGVAAAFIGIAGPVAGLRFELAALSARDPHDARALTWLSALSIVPVTLAATGVLCLLKVLDIGSYGALSWSLVSITGGTVAVAGVYSTVRCWRAREGRFRLIANSLTLQGCLRAAIPVLLAPLSAGAALLLSAEFVARASSIWVMVRGSGVTREPAGPRLTYLTLRSRVQLYWKYPLLLAPSTLIDAAATMIPIPMLASNYGLAAAGKFALVQRLVLLPVALIVGSVGDVFHAHAATVADARDNAVGHFVAATAKRLLLLALLVYVPVAVVAPMVGGWLFGAQWSDAGPMMALLTPLCVAQTTVSPISRGLLLSGREERKLIADVVCLVLPVLALTLARSQPLLVGIACFSASATIAYAIYYVVIVRALKAAMSGRPSTTPTR